MADSQWSDAADAKYKVSKRLISPLLSSQPIFLSHNSPSSWLRAHPRPNRSQPLYYLHQYAVESLLIPTLVIHRCLSPSDPCSRRYRSLGVASSRLPPPWDQSPTRPARWSHPSLLFPSPPWSTQRAALTASSRAEPSHLPRPHPQWPLSPTPLAASASSLAASRASRMIG